MSTIIGTYPYDTQSFDVTKHIERDINHLQPAQPPFFEDNPLVANNLLNENPKGRDNSKPPGANGYKGTSPTFGMHNGPDIYDKDEAKGDSIQPTTDSDIENDASDSDTEEEKQKLVKKESRVITTTQDEFLEDFEKVGRKRINKTRMYFQGLKESQIMTIVDDFIAKQDVSTRDRLGKINDSGRTILHAILVDAQQKRFEEQLRFLFQRFMKEYPELYLSRHASDKNEEKTILHLALRPAAKAESCYFVRFLVDNYPSEAAEILGEEVEKEGSLLLHQIMPFISDCDNAKFLQLFSATNVDADVEEDQHTCCCCSCPRLVSATPRTEISAPSNSDFEAPKRIDNDGFGLISIPAGVDNEGNTVLHLAAQYVPVYTAKQTESQLRLVAKVFSWCPIALVCKNKLDHSVYQHRLRDLRMHMQNKSPESLEEEILSDIVANFLKDKIMHLLDRDHAIHLLRGGYGGTGPDRQTYLELGEAKNALEDKTVAFLNGLEFENILQYVYIPCHPFSTKVNSANSGDTTGDRTDSGVCAEAGSGRQDFKSIFNLLHEKRVKKIIRLIVEDDEKHPHTDEIIEGLDRFEIEDWEWKKVDISSVVLQKAAEHAQQLRLWSSGNHSVLRDWSSCDGLKKLKRLEAVYVFITRRVESKAKTELYKADFEARMKISCPKVKTYVKVDTTTVQTLSPWTPDGYPMKSVSNNWFENMNKFLSFFTNIPANVHGRAPDVRVAIIDDGINLLQSGSDLTRFIAQGESFYTQWEPSFTRTNSFFFSSTEHGTLMATLVHNVCPKAQLYIARLHQGESNSGDLQFTADSAAKAIHWAIQKEVHIISMSWTIPDNTEGTKKLDPKLQLLDDAIKAARNAGILMFGAASDQGLNSSGSSTRLPYPAKCKDGGVICIGAAKDSGYADERAVKDAEFFFPGNARGMRLPFSKEKSEQGQQPPSSSGSSVATAIAAGFTAMIIYCLEISTWGQGEKGPRYREKLRDPNIIKEIFKRKSEDGGFITVPAFFAPEKFTSAKCRTWESHSAEEPCGRSALDQAIHEIILPIMPSCAE